jgi:broad specificity phosphatase PhoE
VDELRKCINEREEYGKFFYRFPNGESGADVYDRVTSFLDAFQREKQKLPEGTTVAIVTHGLTIRLFIKRWFHLNVDTFHSMVSPPPGHAIELVRVGHDENSFMLSEDQLDLLALPKSLSKANGYAHRNKRALGSVSIGAPYI